MAAIRRKRGIYTFKTTSFLPKRLKTLALAYDEKITLICMDERPCKLLDKELGPLPMKPKVLLKVREVGLFQ